MLCHSFGPLGESKKLYKFIVPCSPFLVSFHLTWLRKHAHLPCMLASMSRSRVYIVDAYSNGHVIYQILSASMWCSLIEMWAWYICEGRPCKHTHTHTHTHARTHARRHTRTHTHTFLAKSKSDWSRLCNKTYSQWLQSGATSCWPLYGMGVA